jgi:hypothetical protein
MLSHLPIERIVKLSGNMSKVEAQNRYLECFMDRDKSAVFDAEKNMVIVERRANLKVAIRLEKDEEKKVGLKKQLDELTEKTRQ